MLAFVLSRFGKTCHEKLHKRKEAQKYSLKLKPHPQMTKHATEVNIVAAQLKKAFGKFEEIFGFITKIDRIEQGLEKRHFIDAAMIASSGARVNLLDKLFTKGVISKGDYQKSFGVRSEKKIPTGKLFGLRKFDWVKTPKDIGFVKGKRSSGYFSIRDIHGKSIHNSVKIKNGVQRISARKILLTVMENCGSFKTMPSPVSSPFPLPLKEEVSWRKFG